MKFDCGETWEEEKERKSQWHRWFAWKPVYIANHDCRWLEFVERKGEYCSGYDSDYWNWIYRSIK